MAETIADRIKRLRSDLGINQEVFGKLAGVSKAAVSQWEREIAYPARDALLALQKSKKINPQWIMKGVEPRFVADAAPTEHHPGINETASRYSPDEEDLLKVFRRMDGEMKQKLLKVAKILASPHIPEKTDPSPRP